MIFGRRGRFERQRARAAAAAKGTPLESFYAVGVPDFAADADAVDMIAIDLETDGLDAEKDAILEAGWVGLTSGTIRAATAGRLRLRPEQRLSAQSVVIHHITDDAAADGLAEAEALEALLPALAGVPLVAHFAEIERGFLDAACRRCFGAPFVAPFICTMQLEQRWYPATRAADGLRLGKLRARHGLPAYRAHDGLTDALACAELFLAQRAKRGDAPIRLGDLLAR
ncbi:MAG: exonuclease domain-containing protein [Parasphingopyxis sp.]|uniref:exonuclease domain-containing protein n=1 Tax=Parasphingopyxis sp. TaxID=1920299 RepID=UPI003F9F29FE